MLNSKFSSVFTMILFLAIGLSMTVLGGGDLVPNPQRDFQDCNLESPGLACDPGKLLPKQTLADIDNTLTDLLFNTPCMCRVTCSTSLLSRLVISFVVIPPDSLPELQDFNVTDLIAQKNSDLFRDPLDLRMELFARRNLLAWKLGTCRANDAMILAVTDQDPERADNRVIFVPNAGVRNIMKLECVETVNSRLHLLNYQPTPALIEEIIVLIKSTLYDPCLCGRCSHWMANSFVTLGVAFFNIFLICCLVLFVRALLKHPVCVQLWIKFLKRLPFNKYRSNRNQAANNNNSTPPVSTVDSTTVPNPGLRPNPSVVVLTSMLHADPEMEHALRQIASSEAARRDAELMLRVAELSRSQLNPAIPPDYEVISKDNLPNYDDACKIVIVDQSIAPSASDDTTVTTTNETVSQPAPQSQSNSDNLHTTSPK